MIDWLWMRVRCRAALSLPTGRIASIAADNTVEWESPRWLKARGSYDSTIAAKPIGDILEISGSPAKFLQGHNCFGTDDAFAQGVFVIGAVCDSLDVQLTDDELGPIVAGDVELLRVDINYSHGTGSRANALAWLRAAEQHGNLKHRGRGMMFGDTVYFGRKSRRWSFKGYCKGQELQLGKSPLPKDLPNRDELLAWADDKLRLELSLHARKLREAGLDRLHAWKCDTARELFMAHLAKLNLSGELTMTDAELDHLPGALRTSLEAWKGGTDLRQVLTRPTFYRYRKQLLELAGVDIAVAPVNNRANVVPLVRVIEAVPADVPAWAIGTPIYWQAPARRRA